LGLGGIAIPFSYVIIKKAELEAFHKLLAQANADLGYSSVEIIYNNEKIS